MSLPFVTEGYFCPIFSGGRTVWISDGFYSVHMMTVSDTDTSVNEDDENESEEKLTQISGFHNPLVNWLHSLNISPKYAAPA